MLRSSQICDNSMTPIQHVQHQNLFVIEEASAFASKHLGAHFVVGTRGPPSQCYSSTLHVKMSIVRAMQML